MTKEKINKLKEKSKSFHYTSMEYIEYNEIENYVVVVEKDNIILISGYNSEAQVEEYHWATDSVEEVLECLRDKEDFLITFIPNEWTQNLKNDGYNIRNAWHDYFKEDMTDVVASNAYIFLKEDECQEAAALTQLCRHQSRGFTGQTTEWMQEWLKNHEGFTKNNAVIIERSETQEIVGIICVATYRHESENGPIIWIREVAVKPIWQNQGIGRKLLDQALAYGKYHGAKRAFLAADECNEQALYLYRCLGFVAGEGKSQIDMIK